MAERAIDLLIKDFGAAIGVPDMVLDDQDFCVIGIGENAELVVNFDYYQDDDSLVLYTTLGEIPDDLRYELYEELLRANFFWEVTGGMTLSINPDATHALLCTSIPADGLDAQDLTALIRRIADISAKWSARVAEIAAEDDRLDTGPETETGGRPPQPPQFA
jgi:hypothetical protein